MNKKAQVILAAGFSGLSGRSGGLEGQYPLVSVLRSSIGLLGALWGLQRGSIPLLGLE